MHDIEIDFVKNFDEEDYSCDILIEGLPGVGQVGKLAAETLISELEALKIAEITSIFFPPQVLMDSDGIVSLPSNEIYRCVDKKTGLKIMFLVGDYQSLSPEGHFLLTNTYLDIAEKLGVKKMYTLGGFGTGHLVDDNHVYAAINKAELKDEVIKAGATFADSELNGGIVGASGLLLAFGFRRNIDGICLMGETSGYLVDPKSARCVLEVLSKLLGISVDPSTLEERAKEMDNFVEAVRANEKAKSEDQLSYIG